MCRSVEDWKILTPERLEFLQRCSEDQRHDLDLDFLTLRFEATPNL